MNDEQSVGARREGIAPPEGHREGVVAKASRFLFGNDAFISYARRDATIYSLGLANQLTKKELSCFLDQWGTPAGKELPADVISTLKRSNMLILLGTERAAGSEAVKREIIEFKKTGRTIIPVSFDGALERATWYGDLIAGISIAHESKQALETGKPSETVIDRIVNAENFTRRNKRLRNYFWTTAASVVVMLLVGALAAFLIVRQANAKAADAETRSQAATRQADEAEKRRQTAESEAQRLSTVAQEAQDLQKKAEGRADEAAQKEAEATANAREQQQLAVEQRRIADEQTRIADEQQERSRRLTYIGNMQLAQQSFEMGKTDRSQRLLSEFTPKNESEDLRGYEWFHLWRTLHRKLVELPITGKVTRINSVAFSPTRQEFVTADNQSLKLWKADDLTSNQIIAKFDGSFDHVTYSRDGGMIAAKNADLNAINVWKAQDLTLIKGTDEWPKELRAMAFSPTQNSMLVTADDKEIIVWEVTSNEIRRTGQGVPSIPDISSITFSPDGKYLGVSSPTAIEVWDVPFTNKIGLGEPEELFNSPVVFRDNQTVGFLEGLVFKLWDFKTRTFKNNFKLSAGVQSLPSPDQNITVALSPNGRFLATGELEGVAYGGGVKVWDVRTGESLGTFDGIGLNGEVTALAFSNDGKTLAIGSQGKVQLSDATPAHSVKELQAIEEERRAKPIISADGNVLLTISERVVFFWSTRTEQLERKYARPAGKMVLSPDGSKYVTTVETKKGTWSVQLFDSRTQAPLGEPLGETSEQTVVFSPDGKSIAVGSTNHENYECDAGCLQFWDIASGTKTSGTRPAQKNKIPSYGAVPLLYSPNGRLLVFRNNLVDGHSIDLLDVATKRSLAIIGDYSEGDFTSFAFSPDGNTLAIGGEDSTVSLWDVSSLYKARATGVAEEWKVTDKHFIARLEGHTGSVRSVAFSRDGQTLATASEDETVKLWDTRFYQPLLTLKGYKGSVDFVSFSGDGRSLITSDTGRNGKGYSVKFWHAAAKEDVAAQLRNSAR
jgi:WD40 repeat protein